MSQVDPFLSTLLNNGVLGLVLGWFMLRMENVLKDNTKAITDMTLVVNKLCAQVGVYNESRALHSENSL